MMVSREKAGVQMAKTWLEDLLACWEGLAS